MTPPADSPAHAAPLVPAVYEGMVRHRRLEGPRHAFSMDAMFAYLDVDRIDATLDPLPLWSSRRPAPIRFRRRDYFDGSDAPLGDAVRDLVEARTGHRPAGSIALLTQLRMAGWLFNPLSLYFCWSSDGTRVETIVLEVTNTPWNDRTWYVVRVSADRPAGPWEFAKAMHVSPFLDMDLTYRLRASVPGDRLVIRLEDRRDGRKVFAADLSLRRTELTRRTALLVPLRHPFLTWRVTAGIYAHALRLWRKGVPVHRRPADDAALTESEPVT